MGDNAPTVSTEVTTGREPVATDEINGKHHQKVKLEFGGDDVATPVSTLDPLPIEEQSPLDLSGLAEQTTLAAVLAELGQKLEPADLAALASAAKQDTLIGHVDGVEGSLGTLNGKDFSTEATQANRYGGGKTAAVATIAASGDTTIVDPAPGNAIRLFWVSAINDPDQATTPLVKVRLGAIEVYRAYAVAHWEVFDGAADAALVVNLSDSGSVAVTAHYQEFVP